MTKAICLLVFAVLLAGCATEPEPAKPSETTQAPATQATQAPATEAQTDPPTEPTEPPVVVIDTYLKLPQGFTAASATDEITVYEGPNTPEDTSSIVVRKGPKEDVLSYTQQTLLERLAVAADEGSAQVDTMDIITVDGQKALYAVYSMTVAESPCRCWSYLIPAGEVTYTFTFTDCTEDGTWAEPFAQSGKSIRLLQEGEYAPVDYDGLERYDLGCGMELYAMPGMELQPMEGYDAALLGGRVVTLVFSEPKEKVGEGFSLEEYAQAVTDANGLEACTPDKYGNLATVFTQKDEQGQTYFYYLVVTQTDQAYWICQSACPEEDAAIYADEFSRWSTSLAEIG